jgi:hypothetical protein
VCLRVCAAVPRAPLASPSPLLQPLACADRAHARRDRRAHIATQRQTGFPTPSSSPRIPPPPPASLISPLHTHPSCAHPFFKVAGASPPPGLLRPNLPLVELDHLPRPCSATVSHILAIVPAPPKVNFPAGPPFLSPLFSLSHRLVAGDRRCWFRAVEPRPTRPTTTAPCLLCPRGVAGFGHGARAVRVTKEDDGPDKEDPPVSLPPFRFFVPSHGR